MAKYTGRPGVLPTGHQNHPIVYFFCSHFAFDKHILVLSARSEAVMLPNED